MIKDKNIADKLGRKFIPVQAMAGWDATQAASLGAGAAIYQEPVAAAELAGMQIGAAGDEIYHLMKIPYDLDRDFPALIRIIFSHSTTTADTPDWLINVKGLAIGEAPSDAGATPDEALTYAAKAVSTVANAMEKTLFKAIPAADIPAADVFWQLGIECNGLGGASANEITLWGIELVYTKKRTRDDNRRETTEKATTVYDAMTLN